MPNFNARAAYAEMVAHMTASTKAQHKKSEFLEFLVGSMVGENVTKTTATHFILLYQEKFRQLDELSTIPEQLPDSAKMLMLQNAVHLIKELRKVKITADTNAIVTGRPISYSQYFFLLESAAAHSDCAHASVKSRNIATHSYVQDNYFLDQFEDSPDDLFDIHEGALDGGIDLEPYTLFSYNQAPQFSTFNKKSSFKPNPNFNKSYSNSGPRLPFIPLDLWMKLDSNARDLLKSYSPNKAHTMPSPARKIRQL